MKKVMILVLGILIVFDISGCGTLGGQSSSKKTFSSSIFTSESVNDNSSNEISSKDNTESLEKAIEYLKENE